MCLDTHNLMCVAPKLRLFKFILKKCKNKTTTQFSKRLNALSSLLSVSDLKFKNTIFLSLSLWKRISIVALFLLKLYKSEKDIIVTELNYSAKTTPIVTPFVGVQDTYKLVGVQDTY